MTHNTGQGKGSPPNLVPDWHWLRPGLSNQGVTSDSTRDYALSAQLRARLMGAFLAAIGVLLLVMTVVVAVFRLPQDIMTGLVVLTVVAVFGLGFLLVRRWYVIRLDADGYRVRFARGVGTTAAHWSDVEDLATAYSGDTEVVVVRLRDGRTTTLPVALIEGDPDAFVEELRARLDAANGRNSK